MAQLPCDREANLPRREHRQFAHSVAGTAPRTHVVIIGGGISGLAAAWFLVRTHPRSR